MLQVGIYRPDGLPESFDVCIDNIKNNINDERVVFTESAEPSTLAQCDVIWDPRAGAGHAPPEFIAKLNKPLVVTLHGVGPFVFPGHYSTGLRHRWHILKNNKAKKQRWRELGGYVSRVVTVSAFSKLVINQTIGLATDKIDVVLNGVDASTFYQPEANQIKTSPPYFLHVSNDESRKNVDRIIKAYQGIKQKDKWPLILKLSSDRTVNDPDIRLINTRLSADELAELYKNAGAFVFPSAYEGFGIPIVEAMAARCPVITSRGTACEEVARGFCHLVNPSSTKELRDTMEALMEQPDSEAALDAAAQHALSFSWKEAADQYADIFEKVYREKK